MWHGRLFVKKIWLLLQVFKKYHVMKKSYKTLFKKYIKSKKYNNYMAENV